MAEKYSFFPDIEYTTFDWAAYFGSFIGNGVFPNPSTGLQVVANNNMSITVKAGKAWINGYFYRNESDLIIPISNADGVLKRKDSIVIRLDNAGRKITAKVIKGTFASAPTEPVILRNADFYDLKVAEIMVDAGAISITQSNITDTRLDSAVCGIVTQTVNTVDTTTLYNQIQADMAGFKVNEQANFMTWFATLKDVLNENTATNLLNLINKNTTAIASIPSTPLTMTAKLTAGGTQDLATKQVRNITISSGDPVGGVNGDMHFKYS